MKLKEAFRYQNFLSKMFRDVSRQLNSSSVTIKTKETHLRKKAWGEAENDTTEPALPAYDANALIDLGFSLLQERQRLCAAIAKAKAGCPDDLDGIVLTNKMRQEFGAVLLSISGIKAAKTLYPARGVGYRFNDKGEQMPYKYDIEAETQINFDRDKARKGSRSLLKAADDASAALDGHMVNLDVGFTPVYDANDQFDDVYAAYVAAHPASPETT
jgi:hypothetical protein